MYQKLYSPPEAADRFVEDALLGNPSLGRFLGWQRIDFPSNVTLMTNLAIRTKGPDGIAIYGVNRFTGQPQRVDA